jgi:hypothetical protein
MPDENQRTMRIFIIGPMPAKGKSSQNILDIKKAIDKILAELKVRDCEVTIPQEQYGDDIPSDVFHAIDVSDLVIADISTRSPSVMYELAFAHALGIPTVLIDDRENHDGRAVPAKPSTFYLKHARLLLLDSRSEDVLEECLRRVIENARKGASVHYAQNPLTIFYDVPLADVSAVAGIAAGYVENFLVPVMRAIKHGYEQPDGLRPPVAIVVVVPDKLDDLQAFQDKVRKQLEKAFPGEVKDPKLVVLEIKKPGQETRKDARTVIYVRGVVVDVARTVFPLRRSKRVARLRDEHSPHLADNMEKKLLARFESTLERMSQGDRDIKSDALHVVGFDGLIDKVKAASQHKD